jgi:hypothetical protein
MLFCTDQAKRCLGKIVVALVILLSKQMLFFVTNGKNIINYALPICEG